LHEPNLEPVVEHFSDFLSFCSTFETARSGFGGSGRQKRVIYPGFCLLSDPRNPILDQPVDKNHTFSPVFCLLAPEIQRGLRAKRRFLKHARKCQSSVTGKRPFFKSARNPAQNAAAFTAFVK